MKSFRNIFAKKTKEEKSEKKKTKDVAEEPKQKETFSGVESTSQRRPRARHAFLDDMATSAYHVPTAPRTRKPPASCPGGPVAFDDDDSGSDRPLWRSRHHDRSRHRNSDKEKEICLDEVRQLTGPSHTNRGSHHSHQPPLSPVWPCSTTGPTEARCIELESRNRALERRVRELDRTVGELQQKVHDQRVKMRQMREKHQNELYDLLVKGNSFKSKQNANDSMFSHCCFKPPPPFFANYGFCPTPFGQSQSHRTNSDSYTSSPMRDLTSYEFAGMQPNALGVPPSSVGSSYQPEPLRSPSAKPGLFGNFVTNSPDQQENDENKFRA